MLLNTCRRLCSLILLQNKYTNVRSFTHTSVTSHSPVPPHIVVGRMCIGHNAGQVSVGQCWKCGKEAGAENPLFCPHCRSLQHPPKEPNYFNVLGLQETFSVDEGCLSKTFKDLQKLLHPDKYSNKDKTEQKISAEYSSLVNKAYSTLLQPLSRGMYLLQLKGEEISEKTQMESTFLHEIMERNEQVEEAHTEQEVLRLYKEIKEVLIGLVGELGDALGEGDLMKAKDVLVRMKYYTSIETQLKESMRRMGIVE